MHHITDARVVQGYSEVIKLWISLSGYGQNKRFTIGTWQYKLGPGVKKLTRKSTLSFEVCTFMCFYKLISVIFEFFFDFYGRK